MSIDDRYVIDTPENIEFSYNLAGIGSRFLAAIIDTLLITVVQVILFTVIIALLSLMGDMLGEAATNIVLAIGVLLGFAFLWGYYTFFEMVWNGQSPGKRLVLLRVVRDGGRPINFIASAIRNLVRIVDFLPGFYGLGVVTMFIDKRSRRLGDLTGGTLVVKEQHAVSLETLTTRSEPLPMPPTLPGAPPSQLLPNIHTLTDDDYNLVQEFLRRRGELGRDSRLRLGTQLAQSMSTRLGVPVKSQDNERFLEHVTRDYRLSRAEATRTPQ